MTGPRVRRPVGCCCKTPPGVPGDSRAGAKGTTFQSKSVVIAFPGARQNGSRSPGALLTRWTPSQQAGQIWPAASSSQAAGPFLRLQIDNVALIQNSPPRLHDRAALSAWMNARRRSAPSTLASTCSSSVLAQRGHFEILPEGLRHCVRSFSLLQTHDWLTSDE